MEWYREHDMDVHLIIVGRDASVSRKARQLHCGDEGAKLQEEAASQRLMSKAMRKFILGPRLEGAGAATGGGGGIMASPDGRVVLVSYELMMQFCFDYLKLVYEALGINLNYNPEWKDGNEKYVTPKNLLKGKKPRRKHHLSAKDHSLRVGPHHRRPITA